MKSLATRIVAICFAVTVSVGAGVRAEGVARFESIPDKSKVRVDGTSTVHDWTVKSSNISGYISFSFDVPPDAPPRVVREAIVAKPNAEVDVTIEVKSLKSGDSAMDKKMYEALKSRKHPSITYKLTKLELAKDVTAEQTRFEVETTGELTIAGTTREFQMPMVLEMVDSQHLKITGETSMNMTTFKVKPPKAMLGMIKSGDKVKVTFEWNATRAPVAQSVSQSK